MNNKDRLTPFPFLVLALLALLAGMWAGLLRLGWGWPMLRPTLPISHGPLMICGFLGTVIGIERAVAFQALAGARYRWTFLGPALTSLGALLLIAGLAGWVGPLLITLGSLNLVVVFGVIVRRQPAIFTGLLAAAALPWLIGNGLWLIGRPVHMVVVWWSGFLILTIAGERLELNRVLRLTARIQSLFLGAVGLFGLGLLATLINLDVGSRLVGVGNIAMALWLLRFDIARYTVRKTDLTRFIAVCLLLGYGWLGVGGLLAVLFGGVSAGFHYDAVHHAVFVGFVISMIFGHAPIIFPAVTGRPVPFRSTFYIHLSLLHLSLLLRVSGDLLSWLTGRQWGGLLNAVAILLFLASTAWSMRTATGDAVATVSGH